MTSSADRLKAHLAEYKSSHLGVSEAGEWASTGRFYHHILPRNLHQLNILEEIRDPFWKYAREKGLVASLHRGFHHLTSSQAFAFKLFFLFFSGPEADSAILLKAIGVSPKPIKMWDFEAIPDELEGTNFDFLAVFTDESRLLVEVKLSEQEFGRCKDDDEHRRKLDGIYRERLRGKVSAELLTAPNFFDSYQLLRNVSHLRAGDRLIFLLPRSNRATWRETEQFVENRLVPLMRSNVSLIALEDIVTSLRAERAELSRFADSLAAKYCP